MLHLVIRWREAPEELIRQVGRTDLTTASTGLPVRIGYVKDAGYTIYAGDAKYCEDASEWTACRWLALHGVGVDEPDPAEYY